MFALSLLLFQNYRYQSSRITSYNVCYTKLLRLQRGEGIRQADSEQLERPRRALEGARGGERGLNFLKKINDPDDLLSFSADDKISKFLPVDKSKAKLSPAAVFLPVMIAAAAAVFIIPVTREAILSILPDKAARRPEVTEISLDERKDYLSLEGEFV